MNCQELNRILDDGDYAALTAAEKAAIARHGEVCADCAAAVAADDAVRAQLAPPLPAGLEQRLRALVAAGASRPAARPAAGRAARRGGGRPWTLVGLVLFGAAATAVVGLQVSDRFRTAIDDFGSPAVTAAAPAGSVADSAVDSGADIDPGAALSPAGRASGSDGLAADAGADASAYTVAVAPLRQRSTDPEAIRGSAIVYRALLDELGSIPGLSLVELDADAIADETVSFGAVATLATSDPAAVPSAQTSPGSAVSFSNEITIGANADGARTLVLVDPRASAAAGQQPLIGIAESAVAPSAGAIPAALAARIEAIAGGASGAVYAGTENFSAAANVIVANNLPGIQVELFQTATADSGSSSMPWDYRIDITSVAYSARTPGAWRLDVTGRSRDRGESFSISSAAQVGAPADVDAFVDPIVDRLREQLFPVDDDVIVPISQLAIDPNLPVSERLEALVRLKRMESRSGESLIDSAVVASVLALTQSQDPELRAAVWRALRDVSDPQLIPALSDAWRYEVDDQVRVEAVISLTRFSDDPSARAVLELAGRDDESAGIRLIASYGALDWAGRREYVVSSLLDRSRSDADRLAPLLFDPRAYDSMSGAAPLTEVDLAPAMDMAVAAEIGALLRRQPDANTRAQALERLARVDSPALTPLFLERLEADDSELIRMTAAAMLTTRLDEPGVRFALERALAGDESERVRLVARRTLTAVP